MKKAIQLVLICSSAYAGITRTARLTETTASAPATPWVTTGTVTASTGDTVFVEVCMNSPSASPDVATWNGQTFTSLGPVNSGNARCQASFLDNVTGGTSTLSLAYIGASGAKGVVFATSFTGANGALTTNATAVSGTSGGSTGTNVTTSSSTTCTPNASAQCAWIMGVGDQGPNGDTSASCTVPTTLGQRLGTTGASAASNITVTECYEIDGSGQTQSGGATLATARNWTAVMTTIKEPALSTVTVASFADNTQWLPGGYYEKRVISYFQGLFARWDHRTARQRVKEALAKWRTEILCVIVNDREMAMA